MEDFTLRSDQHSARGTGERESTEAFPHLREASNTFAATMCIMLRLRLFTTIAISDVCISIYRDWNWFGSLYIASPQQGDLRFQGPPSGQDAGSGARTRDRRVPADLRSDSLTTVPPTPQGLEPASVGLQEQVKPSAY
ncbi:hypothetical protein PoB_007455300 [Plakobranchus ocellatus]|uniref:Uncharacterized protein n=1 Tax=Plakobranchus ocellatus TaxID=259542 RepID=A0AAV4DUU6_9GAST|nr:hypothetical protein PoB_007455300 [Plakobranchus ocellatus]